MVALIAFAAMWRYDAISGEKVHGVPEQGVTRAEVFSACRDHLREADAEAVAALSRRAEEFADFINERKAGAGPFSREMVSLRGKWAVVKSYLPFTKPSSHEGYVMRKFEEHIFSKEELAMALRRTVEASVRDLKGIENELAVSLRQEILGRSLAPDEIPLAVGEFRAAVDRLVAASQWDAAKSAGRLVVSEVAAQVGTQVLVRLGVSAGILGVGAANSWWSFGAAFGIGLVVDVVWEWIDNPAKDIEREMLAVLEKLSEKASVAMEMEMQRILNQRSRLWDRTVAEMVR
jgi:hypothetical protein